jgi:hypothetical protein
MDFLAPALAASLCWRSSYYLGSMLKKQLQQPSYSISRATSHHSHFFALGGHVLWLTGLVMGVGQMIGAWLGSQLAIKHGGKVIRPLLVISSVSLSIKLLLDNS